MRVESPSHLVYGNTRRFLPDGRREMQRPKMIENVPDKIRARARKMLQHGIGDFVWASGNGQREIRGSCKKFSGKERRAEREMRLLRAHDSVKPGQVAYGSATQGLWLSTEEWDLRWSALTEAKYLGEEQLGKLGEWEEEPATERMREYIDLGSDLGEKDAHVACHASVLTLAMTEEACWEAGM